MYKNVLKNNKKKNRLPKFFILYNIGCTNKRNFNILKYCTTKDEVFIENVCFKIFIYKKKISLSEMEKKCLSINYTIADFPIVYSKSITLIFSELFKEMKNNNNFEKFPWIFYSKN